MEARAAELARMAMQQRLGVAAAPEHTHVMRWPRVMPQYRPGHLAAVAAAEARAASHWHGRLHLGGNSYYGAGVNDTVLRSHVLAARILAAAA